MRAYTRLFMHTHVHTDTLAPSLLLVASLHPTGKRGATISVVFWFWLGSARGSSGSGVLKTAEVSPARFAAEQLLPACFFFISVIAVGGIAVSRSPFAPVYRLPSRDLFPRRARRPLHRPRRYRRSRDLRGHRATFIEQPHRARFTVQRSSRSESVSLSLASFLRFAVARGSRDVDQKPSPWHFCDYP